jgi:hypothetical protein
MNQKTVQKASGFAALQQDITYLIAALRDFVAARAPSG